MKHVVITKSGKVMVFNVRACAELYALIEDGKLIEQKEIFDEKTLACMF